MKKLFVSLTILFLTTSKAAFAVLPPLWQGVTEMQAILKSADLSAYFTSGDEIQEISKHENTYMIRSQRTTCFVDIVYLPSERLGPVQFVLHFRDV